MRVRHELTLLSTEELEEIGKTVARGRVIGSFFVGKFIDQSVGWRNGGLEILTSYVEGAVSDLPTPTPQIEAPRAKRKYTRRKAK